MNNDSSNNTPTDQNLRITSLNSLLAAAIAKLGDDPTKYASSVESMDPEKRKWLEDVIKSLTVDVVKEMQKYLETVASADSDMSSKEEALELLQEQVENIDNAKDLLTIGGWDSIIKTLLDTNHTSLQWRAADVIATLLYNNPRAQEFANKNDFQNKLMSLINNPSDDDILNKKAWYALSALLGHNPPALGEFFGRFSGVSVLENAISTQSLSVKTKAVFICRSILEITDSQLSKEKLEILLKCIIQSMYKENDDNYLELATRAVALLIERHPNTIPKLKEFRNQLKEYMDNRLKKTKKDKERYEEEIRDLQALKNAAGF